MSDHDVLNVETSETSYPCKPGGFLRIEKFIHIRAVKRFQSPDCAGCETMATIDCIDQKVFNGVAMSPFTGEASTSARDISWTGTLQLRARQYSLVCLLSPLLIFLLPHRLSLSLALSLSDSLPRSPLPVPQPFQFIDKTSHLIDPVIRWHPDFRYSYLTIIAGKRNFKDWPYICFEPDGECGIGVQKTTARVHLYPLPWDSEIMFPRHTIS